MEKLPSQEYQQWLIDIKNKIQRAQIKASLAVNSQLVMLYWEIGESIIIEQNQQHWGNSVISNLAKDLKREYPNLRGFSERNLRLCKQFYQFWDNDFVKWQQLVAKIP